MNAVSTPTATLLRRGGGAPQIKYPDATLIVVSGVTGAGKTAVLGRLIDKLIGENVPPDKIAVLFNDRTPGSYIGDISNPQFAKFQNKDRLVECGCCAGFGDTLQRVNNYLNNGIRYIFIEVDGGSSGITLYYELLKHRVAGKATHIHRISPQENIENAHVNLAATEAVRVYLGDLHQPDSTTVARLREIRGSAQSFDELAFPQKVELSPAFDPQQVIDRRTVMSVLEIALRAGLSTEMFKEVVTSILTCEALLRVKALLPIQKGQDVRNRTHMQWAAHGDRQLAFEERLLPQDTPATMLLRFAETPSDQTCLAELFKIGLPSLPTATSATSADWESGFALIERMVAQLQDQSSDQNFLSAYGFSSQERFDEWFQGVVATYAENRLGLLEKLVAVDSKSTADWQSIANISFQLVSVGLRYMGGTLIAEDLENQLLREEISQLGNQTLVTTLVEALHNCPIDFELVRVKKKELTVGSDFWNALLELHPTLSPPELSARAAGN